MTYKEFNKTSREVKSKYTKKIQKLQLAKKNEIWLLEQKYIGENRKYQNGETVIVKGLFGESNHKMTITSAGIIYGGEIGYKDGYSFGYTSESMIIGKA